MKQKHAPVDTYDTMINAIERNDYTLAGGAALFLPLVILLVWPVQLFGAAIAWCYERMGGR